MRKVAHQVLVPAVHIPEVVQVTCLEIPHQEAVIPAVQALEAVNQAVQAPVREDNPLPI